MIDILIVFKDGTQTEIAALSFVVKYDILCAICEDYEGEYEVMFPMHNVFSVTKRTKGEVK